MKLYLNALGMVNPLGVGKTQIAKNLFSGSQLGLEKDTSYIQGREIYVGRASTNVPELPNRVARYQTRNNQLALLALTEIEQDVREAIAQYGTDRIAVVVGTSTSGIGDNEPAIAEKFTTGDFPSGYHYDRQAPSDISSFIQEYFDLHSPAMTIGTACTSSAKAVVSAARLINSGICDAAIVGGVDSLCKLTVNGFNALESISKERANPFSKNRDGINIGEGAAFFLLSRKPSLVKLVGSGETSDAHHISAPNPTGEGALKAMELAIGNHKVGYVNLHGTATRLNDAMEAKAVSELLGADVFCSSTKSLTGHMLGASGANELGFLFLSITHETLPPHIWDGEVDEMLPCLGFVEKQEYCDATNQILISNSFAFGGNNISLAVQREKV